MIQVANPTPEQFGVEGRYKMSIKHVNVIISDMLLSRLRIKKTKNSDLVQLHHLFQRHLQLHRLQGGGAASNSHILQNLH